MALPRRWPFPHGVVANPLHGVLRLALGESSQGRVSGDPTRVEFICQGRCSFWAGADWSVSRTPELVCANPVWLASTWGFYHTDYMYPRCTVSKQGNKK